MTTKRVPAAGGGRQGEAGGWPTSIVNDTGELSVCQAPDVRLRDDDYPLYWSLRVIGQFL